jgi:hypothetical protein
MTCGFRAVEALMINNFGYTIPESKAADTRIYMDDRTFVDSDLHRALDRVMAWTTWSSSVGLLENENKIQALARTKAVQSQLQALQPVWTQDKTLSALGVSIRAGPVANTALEEIRVQAATQRAKLLACLPLSYRHKMELYRIFVLPKATYGWINRFPPEATANRLFNALTKMNNTNKMANPCIRATIYGGNSHCHPVIGLRMFKRLARMRSSLPVSSGWLSCDSPERLDEETWMARTFSLEMEMVQQCSRGSRTFDGTGSNASPASQLANASAEQVLQI